MDWSWLTPQLATALAAALAATGALIGVLLKGLLDNRLGARQIEVQREIAIAQLETQERIAAASRAEDRTLALLDERRKVYLHATRLAMDIADSLTPIRRQQALGRGAPELLREANRAYKEARFTFGGCFAELGMVAPRTIRLAASSVFRSIPDALDADTDLQQLYERIRDLQASFAILCQEDINAGPLPLPPSVVAAESEPDK